MCFAYNCNNRLFTITNFSFFGFISIEQSYNLVYSMIPFPYTQNNGNENHQRNGKVVFFVFSVFFTRNCEIYFYRKIY